MNEVQQLEDKIRNIEDKVIRLAEQNQQLKKMCIDLMEQRKRLEREQAALKEQLESRQSHVSLLQRRNHDLLQGQESLQEQLERYIVQLDQHIQWLDEL